MKRLAWLLLALGCVSSPPSRIPEPDWRDAPTAALVRQTMGLLESGRLAAARRALASAQARGMNEASFHLLSARLALAEGRFGEAERQLDRATEVAPELASVDALRGRLEELRGHWDRAGAAYAAAARKAEGDPGPILAQARTLHARGLPLEAAHVLEEALEREPLAFQLLAAAGQAYLAGGDATRALARLRRAAALRPGQRPVEHILALALYLTGRYEEVIAQLEHEDREGLPVHLTVALGRSALFAGRFDLCREVLEPYLERAPQDAAAWFDLARAAFLAHRPRDAERAARRAVQLRPDAAPYQTLIGHLHTLAGRSDAARRHYARALELGADPASLAPLLAALPVGATRPPALAAEEADPDAPPPPEQEEEPEEPPEESGTG